MKKSALTKTTLAVLAAALVTHVACRPDAASSRLTPTPASTQPAAGLFTLQDVQNAVGMDASEKLIMALSAMNATVCTSSSSAPREGKGENIDSRYLQENGQVCRTDITVESIDLARWIREFSKLGPAREVGEGTFISLADGLEFMVVLRGNEIHAVMVTTNPTSSVSASFQGIPVRRLTKASELITSLVQAKKPVEITFGAVGGLSLQISQEVRAQGFFKFVEGKVSVVDLNIPVGTLNPDARKALARELMGEDAAKGIDVAGGIPRGARLVRANGGAVVSLHWVTVDNLFMISLATSDENALYLQRQLDASTKGHSTSNLSKEELRERIEANMKVLEALPAGAISEEERKAQMDKLKKLRDAFPTTAP